MLVDATVTPLTLFSYALGLNSILLYRYLPLVY